jgi:hypothetical protein
MKEYKPLCLPRTAVLLKSVTQFANGCQLFLPSASEYQGFIKAAYKLK